MEKPASKGAPRVLIADPDVRSAALAAEQLVSDGFSAAVAADLDAAVALLADPVHLVFAVIDAPGFDGLALCKAMRGSPSASAPFLAVAADGEVSASERALAAGAFDVLRSPLSARDARALARLFANPIGALGTAEGSLAELPLFELLCALTSGRRSGRLELPEERAVVSFLDGRIVEVCAGGLAGEDVLTRLLLLSRGTFRLELGATPRRGSWSASRADLVAREEPRRRRFQQALAQLGGEAARFKAQISSTPGAATGLPPSIDRLLRLFDGERTLWDALRASELDAAAAVEAVVSLKALGLLADSAGGPWSASPLPSPESTLSEGAPGALGWVASRDAAGSAPAEAGSWRITAQPADSADPTGNDSAWDIASALERLERSPPLREGPAAEDGFQAHPASSPLNLPRRAAPFSYRRRRSRARVTAAIVGTAAVLAAAAAAVQWSQPEAARASSNPRDRAQPLPAAALSRPEPAPEPVPQPATPARAAAPARRPAAELGAVDAGAAQTAAEGQAFSPSPGLQSLLAEGRRLMASGRPQAALKSLEAAADASPQDASLQVLLAMACLDSGKPAEAAQSARRALALEPENPRAHLILATAYEDQGQEPRARAEYETYLRLAPKGEFARDVRAILGMKP